MLYTLIVDKEDDLKKFMKHREKSEGAVDDEGQRQVIVPKKYQEQDTSTAD